MQELVFQKLVSGTEWNRKDQGCWRLRKSRENPGRTREMRRDLFKKRNVMEKPGRTVYLTLIKIFRQDHTKQITSFACKNCNFLNGEKASIWCLSAVENI